MRPLRRRRVLVQGLAVGAAQGGFEFRSQRRGDGYFRDALSAEGIVGQTGGDLEGARDLAEGHALDFAVAEAIEETASGVQKLLPGSPLLLTELGGATSPVRRVLAVEVGLGGSLLLEEAGVKGLEAVAPAVAAGPALEGIMFLTRLLSEGQEGTAGPQFKEGQEGGIGARGLAGETGEGFRRRKAAG